MKWRAAAIIFAVLSAQAQGTFQNLDFEEADIVPIVGNPLYPYAVTVANALPGWTVDYGAVQQTQILYNNPSLGTTAVTLFASGYPGPVASIIDGNFSVALQSGLLNGMPAPASISQTGQIPSGTQSLLFDSVSGGFSSEQPPEVLIGNDLLTLFPVGSGQGVSTSYTIYGANISAWAGQSEQLTFSAPAGAFIIDDISFSPTAVIPEPSPLALTGIAGLLFALYRRFAPKCQ
jgi:hypothetical protein